MNGLRLSNSILARDFEGLNKGQSDELEALINELKMNVYASYAKYQLGGVIYELWEVDTVKRKLLKKVDENSDINVARQIAKKLAEGWCEDEKPKQHYYNAGHELWIGKSDFGIIIKRVKVCESQEVNKSDDAISDPDIIKQLEEGKKSNVKVRNFEDIAKELQI